jgi:septal ring factor EnvC (AmiA/AmiB activator)
MADNGEKATISTIMMGLTIAGGIASALFGVSQWINSTLAPINEKIIFLQKELDKNDAVDATSVQDRLGVHADIAELKTGRAEIETQFKNLDERTKRMDQGVTKDFDNLSGQMQASQNDRQVIHAQVAGVEVRFAEIETQFRNAKDVQDRNHAEFDKSLASLERLLGGRIDNSNRLIDQLGTFTPRHIGVEMPIEGRH